MASMCHLKCLTLRASMCHLECLNHLKIGRNARRFLNLGFGGAATYGRFLYDSKYFGDFGSSFGVISGVVDTICGPNGDRTTFFIKNVLKMGANGQPMGSPESHMS